MLCSRLRRMLALLALLTLSLSSQAQERILSFHSDIQIQSDASMIVTETIRVRAEGRNIRRGIYREFPTRYTDRAGSRLVVDFEVLGLDRDGRPEIFSVTTRANGVRVDFGGDDFLQVPAEYEYALRYRTDRQIGYFEGHDELYWNVTGLGWDFEIENASATVTLPEAVAADSITMEGYTGPLGATGQDYTVSVADGRADIRTSASLPDRSGLTLVMTFPKGIVHEPALGERVRYLLTDNLGVLLGLLALCASLVWLMLAWSRVGRDPRAGVIFPHYEPPGGLSPASARYIMRMGYDSKAFTAAVVSLAVKGYVRISQTKKDYTLHKLDSNQELAAGEKALFEKLFSKGAIVELKNENHAIVSRARYAHKSALRKNYLNTYFKINGRYLLPSLAGSALIMLLIVMTNSFVPLVMVFLLLIVVVHGIFAWLLKAPTGEGRKVMDKLEGFKLYLEVAEKDDLNVAHPPELTPELFERFLPFAIALGVEQAWAERFEKVFAQLQETRGVSYQPLWYAGAFNAGRMGDFSRSIGSAMDTAISSAATPPGSSSGSGGGGFSGGGGGGGGGGGR
ncbi:MAG: DUF2207 domain-containing protein [Pseudohongiella sp.]|nr:DUF2207 domain-containing protein [Pseudohongiella sp.]MDO9518733.1 DUF2207 domain-containing protein [Pseudohongiella sp.]MDP2126771.1 DUF2207 domain-containing protein [Pseudohongiella sp.]